MSMEILSVCWVLKKRIDSEKEKLKSMKDLVRHITTEIDGLPRDGNIGSRIEKLTAKIIDSEKAIAELTEIKIICATEIQEYINQRVKKTAARAVLFQRYGKCKLFREIIKELNYSARRVYELHLSGIKEIKKCSRSAVGVQ